MLQPTWATPARLSIYLCHEDVWVNRDGEHIHHPRSFFLPRCHPSVLLVPATPNHASAFCWYTGPTEVALLCGWQGMWISRTSWTAIGTFHLKCHTVCSSVILLCYGITCLWFCNKRSGVNYQLIKKGVICAGSCISTLTAELHTRYYWLQEQFLFYDFFKPNVGGLA